MKHNTFIIVFLLLTLTCKESRNEDAHTRSKATHKEQKQTLEKSGVKVVFPSLDGLEISAMLYEEDKDYPVIVLCHQARFNKFEYADIAPKLNKLGFNCLAIDQRSGGPISDYINETAVRAKKQNKAMDYLDAEQDIVAAIRYAVDKYHRPLILWGSSYSSTLALYLAVENNDIDAVISFSPGNYFAEQKGSLTDLLSDFEKPMFITSSGKEIPDEKKLLAKHEMKDLQVLFQPEGEGYHGSKALWKNQPGGQEYWDAITDFLTKIRAYLLKE